MDGSTIIAVTFNGVSLDCPAVELRQTKAERLPFDAVSPRGSEAAVRQTVSMPNIMPQRLMSIQTPKGPCTQLPLDSLPLHVRVQVAILNHGIDGAWERIADLAVDNAPPVSGVPMFKIHAIVDKHGHKAFANLQVLIGINYVPLTVVASCSIGCRALSDLFTQFEDTRKLRLRKSTIRQTLKSLELEPRITPFEVTRLGKDLVLSWNVPGSRPELYPRDSPVGAFLDAASRMHPPSNTSTLSLPVTPEQRALNNAPPMAVHPHRPRHILSLTPDDPATLSLPTFSETEGFPAPTPCPTRIGDFGTQKPDSNRDAWRTKNSQSDDQHSNIELESKMSFDNDDDYDAGIFCGTLSWIRRGFCCF